MYHRRGYGRSAPADGPPSIAADSADAAGLLDGRDAARIDVPVLYVGGADSGPLFAEVRALILDWLPHAEDVVITGADHSLAITHPGEIAAALASFVRRHPIAERRSPTTAETALGRRA